MIKKKRFNIPIYGVTVYVCIFDDVETLNKQFGVTADKYCDACTITNNDKGITVGFRYDAVNHENIAHEAVHVVNQVFIWKSLALDPYNDEAQAYLIGFVVHKINKALEKLRK